MTAAELTAVRGQLAALSQQHGYRRAEYWINVALLVSGIVITVLPLASVCYSWQALIPMILGMCILSYASSRCAQKAYAIEAQQYVLRVHERTLTTSSTRVLGAASVAIHERGEDSDFERLEYLDLGGAMQSTKQSLAARSAVGLGNRRLQSDVHAEIEQRVEHYLNLSSADDFIALSGCCEYYRDRCLILRTAVGDEEVQNLTFEPKPFSTVRMAQLYDEQRRIGWAAFCTQSSMRQRFQDFLNRGGPCSLRETQLLKLAHQLWQEIDYYVRVISRSHEVIIREHPDEPDRQILRSFVEGVIGAGYSSIPMALQGFEELARVCLEGRLLEAPVVEIREETPRRVRRALLAMSSPYRREIPIIQREIEQVDRKIRRVALITGDENLLSKLVGHILIIALAIMQIYFAGTNKWLDFGFGAGFMLLTGVQVFAGKYMQKKMKEREGLLLVQMIYQGNPRQYPQAVILPADYDPHGKVEAAVEHMHHCAKYYHENGIV